MTTKFNAAALTAMKETFNKSQYIKREWITDDECTMNLSEYSELIDPTMSHVEDNPIIIAKERKDGNIFLKMWIPLEGGSGIEYDLSFENDFEEGDEIDKNSLTFCIEKFLDKSHGYATGEIIVQ